MVRHQEEVKMGRFADLLDAPSQEPMACEKSEKSEIRDTDDGDHNHDGDLIRLIRFFRNLESNRPAGVDLAEWQQAVEDARTFLTTWGEQAAKLGWTSEDLFGVHQPPARPSSTYRRLSRYDATGLVWLLDGRRVVALTEDTATIATPNGGRLTFRPHRPDAR
jgi:hypothetical protein